MMSTNGSVTGVYPAITDGIAPVSCPECSGRLVRRSHRNGLAEEMLSLVYVYPFRCRICAHRFLALQWGIRYYRNGLAPAVTSRWRAPVPLAQDGDRRREEVRQSPAG